MNAQLLHSHDLNAPVTSEQRPRLTLDAARVTIRPFEDYRQHFADSESGPGPVRARCPDRVAAPEQAYQTF
jgi:hypothetical protein